MTTITTAAIIGAGLAGCECALRLARAGVRVTLFEMKPAAFSPAHSNPDLGELVCSNSLRSDDIASGVGLLKQEMRELGSIVMEAADATRVPAGKALAVDRDLFARHITAVIEAEPGITLERREVASLDDPALASADVVVVAAGPLASAGLSDSLAAMVGGQLYFYDAIAPIIAAESIDLSIAFSGSRYGEPGEEGDYLNCPMNRDEYDAFYEALLAAEKVPSRDFEKELHFEGCMPIEALAERGPRTLVFGPFKPVGFTDPRTGTRPYAIIQLRAENRNKTAFNIVGCQTKLKYAEQERVFRMIPGLAGAEFVRHGSVHRNTYVNAPRVLADDLSLRADKRVFLAGQITGVEGYVESAACGMWLGMVLAARIQGRELPTPPPQTALGALLMHLRTPVKNFQPSNANFGLMPELGLKVKKRERKPLYSARAREHFVRWLAEAGVTPVIEPLLPTAPDAADATGAIDTTGATGAAREETAPTEA
ncbi:methylenetetrahydrofolate--tRNA-(uracil(54)-C(5))-methyltransferase (FADH(2)-oxidizing) TrmFO [Nitratidesulfovibrio vulgaris]|uniref:Methylenetetrahydrofolate--tRNA-(uracil-5-)-methyltransferase TrmFO n=1 Tax=Nitratidesulfovibrio vulgaris (strain DP4) TaxID=391774 RepID=TRMFO_NITV4|nr:methylenetetrahydrofolate--tRNA-(uracil(54)-C(5))-methyltransferase (FADH(2)-oxidizing) TrmFO [Nitratidesulfovibrio vulgaris]A1VBW6.1 RecName: Full=Methylenetetrahydrofolate--tRNA-(uracil-5-)-methyltransferase TrmFO; AltName: Full=Folate-dependent tRNA (uracil-5-)-methyltransferase; AltName: Full=Folate-dependent tRNA(M-5-U54)-methyltransferase [Nitratidesulfovibrio vulgaris DP4]ABM27932.1 gid protein [Nitratidesulfovibrio vulgaris DP4]GEB80511.1 methylenetetrahydrofolate--tRNA-(uracil-5-)-me